MYAQVGLTPSMALCALTNNVPFHFHQQVRLATLTQENAVLKSELDLLRLRCKSLSEENRSLRQASVSIVSWQPRQLSSSALPTVS